ncbi:MAG: nucleoside triphosphate pyrophosphohydrolase [Alphaproteobacteria bacterium]|nr:nucleoside triphosphate pyrophosphohydrolase [Alphaproteobacteria bacterium]
MAAEHRDPGDTEAVDDLAPRRPYTIDTLIQIMAALRDPEMGCPWDKQQTFESIAPYTVEEAYEVADAISRGDLADLRDELGDLLLQVVYHARIAEEAGAFGFADVAASISDKMVRRHPHVFGTADERSAGAEPGFWERIKADEKAAKLAERQKLGGAVLTCDSLLDDVPVNLPALSQALKLQNKAARVGFDWPSLSPVLAKMREELGELDEAIARGETDEVRDEFGDLLFVMANVARHLEIDPEAALSLTNAKFRRRFGRVEALLRASGRDPDEATLEEMDALWDRAKAEERGAGD